MKTFRKLRKREQLKPGQKAWIQVEVLEQSEPGDNVQFRYESLWGEKVSWIEYDRLHIHET